MRFIALPSAFRTGPFIFMRTTWGNVPQFVLLKCTVLLLEVVLRSTIDVDESKRDSRDI